MGIRNWELSEAGLWDLALLVFAGVFAAESQRRWGGRRDDPQIYADFTKHYDNAPAPRSAGDTFPRRNQNPFL